MSKYKDLKRKHHKEMRQLLVSASHMTIREASAYLGIDGNSLRRMAYDFGIPFEKANHNGKTSTSYTIKYKAYRDDIVTLPKEPWNKSYAH